MERRLESSHHTKPPLVAPLKAITFFQSKHGGQERGRRHVARSLNRNEIEGVGGLQFLSGRAVAKWRAVPIQRWNSDAGAASQVDMALAAEPAVRSATRGNVQL